MGGGNGGTQNGRRKNTEQPVNTATNKADTPMDRKLTLPPKDISRIRRVVWVRGMMSTTSFKARGMPSSEKKVPHKKDMGVMTILVKLFIS